MSDSDDEVTTRMTRSRAQKAKESCEQSTSADDTDDARMPSIATLAKLSSWTIEAMELLENEEQSESKRMQSPSVQQDQHSGEDAGGKVEKKDIGSSAQSGSDTEVRIQRVTRDLFIFIL